MTECKVCNHPDALRIMQKVFAGDLTYVQAAKELNLPIPTVWKCFKEHWETIITEGSVAIKLKEAKTTGDYVEILKGLIDKFIVRLDKAIGLPASTYTDAALTRLSKELRGMMRDILEFEGKLKVTPLIQLTVLQTQMTKLTSVLFSELCPECQKQLLKVLPELQEPPRVDA